MADGKKAFAEDIGIGLLAESVARGSFDSAIQMWSAAVSNQLNQSASSDLSFASCVYSGRVKEFTKLLQEQDAVQVERLKTLAEQKDPSLASRPGVLVYALDRGGPTLAGTVLSSLQTLNQAQLPLPALLTTLEALEDSTQFMGDEATVTIALRDLIEKRLLPSLSATTAGAVFLASTGGASADVALSVRCGSLLLRAGPLLQSPRLAALGRALIVSSVSLASDNGFLPATVVLASGHVSSQSGTLAPESVYAMLPTGRYVPHELPLFRLMGPRRWVWTASEMTSAIDADGQIRLVFAYPAGVPQHLVFRGLQPFQQIKMHGIPWHSDPSYAKYSDGWDYDPTTRTLFMKITGKADKEEVDFTF
jgi:hypothetical protein